MVKLRDYQEKALEFKDYQALLLDMGVGTGKSYTSIALAKEHPTEKKFFIVPASLVLQWYEVLTQDWKEKSVLLYKGDVKERKSKLTQFDNYEFIVMSYNILRNDFKKLWKKMKGATIIADEAQILKNKDSKIFKCFRKLQQFAAPKFILLSATIISEPVDAYAITKLINPKAYQSFQHFMAVHAIQDEYGSIEEYKNLDLLHTNLYKNAYRVGEEVLNLEEPVIIPVPYALDKKHLDAYNSMVDDMFIETDEEFFDFTNQKNFFHLAQQFIISHPLLDKIKCYPYIYTVLNEILSYLDKEEKVVIFSRYVNTTEKLATFFNAAKYYSKVKEKEEFIIDIHRHIVINLQAGGAGLDGLQKVSHITVFTELPLTPPEFKQAVGRIHRSGQEHPVIVYVPYAKKTIQETLWWRLRHKATELNKITKNELKQLLKGGKT